MRTETETARLSSPDKKTVAIALQVDPGGGATVGFTTEVYLAEASKPARRDLQFKGYSCGPVSIAWQDDRILKISYWPHCHILTFDNGWYPPSDPMSGERVELVLERKGDPDNPWLHAASHQDRSPQYLAPQIRGRMYLSEEYLFWDNSTLMKQIGVGK